MTDYRYKDNLKIEIDGMQYPVEIVEVPFREGLELRCTVDEETFRVSDRGLGLHEAKRILELEIKKFLA